MSLLSANGRRTSENVLELDVMIPQTTELNRQMLCSVY